MSLLFVMAVFSFLLVSLLKLVSLLISEVLVLSREEASAYECGFEHHNVSRVPFSLRYFFLTLIFLLFDLEVVLMFFSPFVLFSSVSVFVLLVLFFFVLFLFSSLVYEWVDGSLEWVS